MLHFMPHPPKAPILGYVLIGGPVATQFDSKESVRAFCSEWAISEGVVYPLVAPAITAQALAAWENHIQESEGWKDV